MLVTVMINSVWKTGIDFNGDDDDDDFPQTLADQTNVTPTSDASMTTSEEAVSTKDAAAKSVIVEQNPAQESLTNDASVDRIPAETNGSHMEQLSTDDAPMEESIDQSTTKGTPVVEKVKKMFHPKKNREEELAAKYAALPLEERAFQILLDLGMLEQTG